MDQFDAMRAFVQAVDRGRCTRAARRLEDRVGTRLLAGTTRSVTPTAEGLTYCRHARTLIEQVDVAEAMLRKGASAPAGRLRVNVAVAMGRLVFAPEIRGLLERYPRFTLEQGCSDRAVDLVGEGAECELRGGVLPDSQLSTHPVGDRRFVLYAAPHCIDGRGLPDIPDDLVGRHQIRQRRRPLPGAGRARSHRARGVRRQPLPDQRRARAGAARLAVPVAAAAPGDADGAQARGARPGLHGLGARAAGPPARFATGDALSRPRGMRCVPIVRSR
jgi:DNA-binding transcriptional LysR family regulator